MMKEEGGMLQSIAFLTFFRL